MCESLGMCYQCYTTNSKSALKLSHTSSVGVIGISQSISKHTSQYFHHIQFILYTFRKAPHFSTETHRNVIPPHISCVNPWANSVTLPLWESLEYLNQFQSIPHNTFTTYNSFYILSEKHLIFSTETHRNVIPPPPQSKKNTYDGNQM